MKQYFRDWVETQDCPRYVQHQYFQDNDHPVRGVTAPTGQASKKSPQATGKQCAGTEEPDEDAEEGEGGAEYSDTEDSESDEVPAPDATQILRQLCGASKADEVDRWAEV